MKLNIQIRDTIMSFVQLQNRGINMCAELVEFYDIKGFIVMISIAIGVAFTTWLLMKKLNSN